MNKRAEMRRISRQKEKDSKVRYNFTAEEVDNLVKKRAEKMLEEIYDEAVEEAMGMAMVLLLTVPLTVLKESYWQKTYKKRLPIFADQVIDMLNKCENDEINIENLREKIWEDARIRIDRDFVDEKKGEKAYGRHN